MTTQKGLKSTEELMSAISAASYAEGDRQRLNCKDAFAIAERLGLGLNEISRACNQNNIRISKCQLGCFE
ncbi:MAG: hypothetical protein JW941_09910 [Candidatus Coatesbacteria bacterium]|nr:hypothetical protein [Candidatus Coatesbacteria bacterium]